jgi:hypothetical protein
MLQMQTKVSQPLASWCVVVIRGIAEAVLKISSLVPEALSRRPPNTDHPAASSSTTGASGGGGARLVEWQRAVAARFPLSRYGEGWQRPFTRRMTRWNGGGSAGRARMASASPAAPALAGRRVDGEAICSSGNHDPGRRAETLLAAWDTSWH